MTTQQMTCREYVDAVISNQCDREDYPAAISVEWLLDSYLGNYMRIDQEYDSSDGVMLIDQCYHILLTDGNINLDTDYIV